MNKTQDYIDQYAQYAMEQMERYGIPASITLAQALIESGRGQSRLARQENNHFGIKATKSWVDNGGGYGVYTDDKPNEKFCSYQSVRDSFEHHSRFIVDNSRYGQCLSLPVNDYRSWAEGLQKAGYATSRAYSSTLISVIESNNLQKYDQMVLNSPGRYATDYQADLPDRTKESNYRGLDRSNVRDSNDLSNYQAHNSGYGDEQDRAQGASQDQEQSLEQSQAQSQSQEKNNRSNDLSRFQVEEGEDFESWMRRLVAADDDQDRSQSNSADPITNMVITMFTSLFAIAAMIDNKPTLEQSAEARRAVNDQEIDLMPILNQQNNLANQSVPSNQMSQNPKGTIDGIDGVRDPKELGAISVNGIQNANIQGANNPNNPQGQSTKGPSETRSNPTQSTLAALPSGIRVEDIRSCKFCVSEQAKATIVVEDSQGKVHSYAVSSKDLANLQSTIKEPSMSAQQKSMAVAAFIGTSMARSTDRNINRQLVNSNQIDQTNSVNGNSINSNSMANTAVAANTQSLLNPSLQNQTIPNPSITTSQAVTENSTPSPTITISRAAQISSRNYEIAENQSQTRDGQTYSR